MGYIMNFLLVSLAEMSIIHLNTSRYRKLGNEQSSATDIFLDRQKRFSKLGLRYRQYLGFWTGFPESMFKYVS